jgi:hypothetical protein
MKTAKDEREEVPGHESSFTQEFRWRFTKTIYDHKKLQITYPTTAAAFTVVVG